MLKKIKEVEDYIWARTIAALVVFVPIILGVLFLITKDYKYLHAMGWYVAYWGSYILVVMSLGFMFFVPIIPAITFAVSLFEIGTVVFIAAVPLLTAMVIFPICFGIAGIKQLDHWH